MFREREWNKKLIIVTKNTTLSSGLLSSFVNQTLLKEAGKKPWMKCCINCKLKNLIKASKGKILSSLKSGSVCELYLEPFTILMAFFA